MYRLRFSSHFSAHTFWVDYLTILSLFYLCVFFGSGGYFPQLFTPGRFLLLLARERWTFAPWNTFSVHPFFSVVFPPFFCLRPFSLLSDCTSFVCPFTSPWCRLHTFFWRHTFVLWWFFTLLSFARGGTLTLVGNPPTAPTTAFLSFGNPFSYRKVLENFSRFHIDFYLCVLRLTRTPPSTKKLKEKNLERKRKSTTDTKTTWRNLPQATFEFLTPPSGYVTLEQNFLRSSTFLAEISTDFGTSSRFFWCDRFFL